MLKTNRRARRVHNFNSVAQRALNVNDVSPTFYISVHQRIFDISHTLAYVQAIRHCVTGPLNVTFLRILSGFVGKHSKEVKVENCFK